MTTAIDDIGRFSEAQQQQLLDFRAKLDAVVAAGAPEFGNDDVSRTQLAIIVLALGGVALVFGLLVSVLAARASAAPIKTVRDGMARVETGELLRRLQRGENLSLPHSRPMPVIGTRCHELRVRDATVDWRIVYRVDPDAVVILEVFAKKTGRTPKRVARACRRRLDAYDREVE